MLSADLEPNGGFSSEMSCTDDAILDLDCFLDPSPRVPSTDISVWRVFVWPEVASARTLLERFEERKQEASASSAQNTRSRAYFHVA